MNNAAQILTAKDRLRSLLANDDQDLKPRANRVFEVAHVWQTMCGLIGKAEIAKYVSVDGAGKEIKGVHVLAAEFGRSYEIFRRAVSTLQYEGKWPLALDRYLTRNSHGWRHKETRMDKVIAEICGWYAAIMAGKPAPEPKPRAKPLDGTKARIDNAYAEGYDDARRERNKRIQRLIKIARDLKSELAFRERKREEPDPPHQAPDATEVVSEDDPAPIVEPVQEAERTWRGHIYESTAAMEQARAEIASRTWNGFTYVSVAAMEKAKRNAEKKRAEATARAHEQKRVYEELKAKVAELTPDAREMWLRKKWMEEVRALNAMPSDEAVQRGMYMAARKVFDERWGENDASGECKVFALFKTYKADLAALGLTEMLPQKEFAKIKRTRAAQLHKKYGSDTDSNYHREATELFLILGRLDFLARAYDWAAREMAETKQAA